MAFGKSFFSGIGSGGWLADKARNRMQQPQQVQQPDQWQQLLARNASVQTPTIPQASPMMASGQLSPFQQLINRAKTQGGLY